MDKKIIKGLIDEKLEVIQEQFSIIRDYEGKIPIIELDLLMASIRDLYELVLSLQLENVGGTVPPAGPAVEAAKPAPAVAEVPVEETAATEPIEEEIPAGLPEEEIPEDEPVVVQSRVSHSFISMEPIREEEETIQSPEPEPSVPEPTLPGPLDPGPEPPGPQEPETLDTSSLAKDQDIHEQMAHEGNYPRTTFDLFSENAGSTLADRFKDDQEKRIADKLQENKIDDLRTTIGINDKFLFINELFEGNMRIYDESINKLNSSSTIAQTDLLLLDLKIAYNWDSESPTVKKFVELVRRKF